jgi:hypothetical protein
VIGAAALTGPGFHGYEPAEGCTWTNGHALLLPSVHAEPRADALRIHVCHTTHYALLENQGSLAA